MMVSDIKINAIANHEKISEIDVNCTDHQGHLKDYCNFNVPTKFDLDSTKSRQTARISVVVLAVLMQ